MDKHIEIWNIARKLKLGTDFYKGLDTLLTKIESDNQQLILQNVSNNEVAVLELECFLCDAKFDNTEDLDKHYATAHKTGC